MDTNGISGVMMFELFVVSLVIIGLIKVFLKNVLTEEEEDSSSFSRDQIRILYKMDLLVNRYRDINAGWKATFLVRELEGCMKLLGADKANSSVLKTRLVKVYQKLIDASVELGTFFEDVAISFARRNDLFPKTEKEEPKYNFGYRRNLVLAV